MTSDPENVVRAIYAAFGRGDLPAILASLTSDVEWVLQAPARVPFAGRFRGPAEVQRFFGLLAEHAEIRGLTIDAVVAGGERVVVLGHETMQGRTTGRAGTWSWVHVWTLQGGKVKAWLEVCDSATMAGLFAQAD